MWWKNKQKSATLSEREIYETFAHKMMRVCLRYLPIKEDAEECLQNGFLKIFQNMKNFVPNESYSFDAWVRKIMVNECLMMLRQQNKFQNVELDKIQNQIYTEYHSTDDEEYYLNLIKSLPTGYRTVFNLCAIEGYTHKEISEMLEITESTSRSQLTHARKWLKEEIEKRTMYA